ncbi:MAG: DUF1800 domain-containing protein [Bacteroidota bacterium]
MKTLLTNSLSPYTGSWSKVQAAHLLRRSTFGATFEQIKEVEILGLDMAVQLLLSDLPHPSPPLNYFHEDDPYAPIGTSWVDKRYPQGDGFFQRRFSLDAWVLGQLFTQEISIREKMVLFWHNHFAVERGVIEDAKALYKYSKLLRENALGNFRQLVKDITLDPAMLWYLNGRDNTKNNPNENYARELLELFTIGKGDIAGPGDYTTFTEEDVIQIARVLTGWKDIGMYSSQVDELYVEFFEWDHDTGTKTLSPRFDEVQISNAGQDEYSNLIDIIFQKRDTALYICRKIYRWFVNFDITPAIESEVIESLAQHLIDNDFDVIPVMEILLKSEHFYSTDIRGAVIKNPMEFVFSVLNGFEVEMPEDFIQWYTSLKHLSNYMEEMQMVYFAPPSVAGWEAFYLQPQFYKQWINSVTLRPRMEFTDRLSTEGFNFSGFDFQIDVLSFISKLDNPAEPNDLIADISTVLFPDGINEAQVDFLKEILIPGLPDFEWTLEYGNYLENPDNAMVRASVEARLRDMIKAMLTFPEFYTN